MRRLRRRLHISSSFSPTRFVAALRFCPAGRSPFPILAHSTSGLARFSKRRKFLKPATYPRLRLLSKISRTVSAESPKPSGKGSRLGKYSLLKELIERADSHERPILLRLLHNELRIGLHDGLIQEAIARASGTDLKTVRRATLFLSDLAEVASIALTAGMTGLKQVDIKLFVPLLPMLSELSQDFDEIFTAHGGKTALEFKYDGARVQIHKDGERVRIWSRRLSEVTSEPAGNRGDCAAEIFKGILSFSTRRSWP